MTALCYQSLFPSDTQLYLDILFLFLIIIIIIIITVIIIIVIIIHLQLEQAQTFNLNTRLGSDALSQTDGLVITCDSSVTPRLRNS